MGRVIALSSEGLGKTEGSSPVKNGTRSGTQWLKDKLCPCGNDSPLYIQEREGKYCLLICPLFKTLKSKLKIIFSDCSKSMLFVTMAVGTL